jgi:HEAT repeat protein
MARRPKWTTSERREDVRVLLHRLQDGTLPPASLTEDATYHAIHELGRAQVAEAIPIIEGYVTHADAQYRYVALEALTNHFRLQRHWPTAVDALRHDSDDHVRMGAAAALGYLMADTRDPATLRELAITLSNPYEDDYVRCAAWAAMRAVQHYDAREQCDLALHSPHLEQDVDWESVRALLPVDTETH